MRRHKSLELSIAKPEAEASARPSASRFKALGCDDDGVPARVLIPYRIPEKAVPYVEAIRAAGGEPEAVSVEAHCDMSEYAGLLLTGGTDVDPRLYSQDRHSETEDPDEKRDRVEGQLVDEALERDLPILAICRGMQLLNVHCGGTLHQHLGSRRHDPELNDRGAEAHRVSLEPESHLCQIYDQRELKVNSRHHQAVDRLGEGLRVAARDGDIVEGLEMPTRPFVVAVQWHPEDQVASFPEQLRLFQHFVYALKHE